MDIYEVILDIIVYDSGCCGRVQVGASGRLVSGYPLFYLGKSSLLCQFVDGKFDEQLLSTIGVDFKFRREKVGSDEVKLQIWDTAGNGGHRQVSRRSGRS